jgi:predicted nucleic acid-binding protein
MAGTSLAEIPNHTAVFIDANVFIYHFSGPTALSSACSSFLNRVEHGLVRGLTSTVVMIEVLHRLMILEAVSELQLPPREVPRYLKEHPQQARSLKAHLAVPAKVRQIGVEMVTVGIEEIELSHEVKQRYGFLTNDALLLATMQRAGISR